MKTIEGGLEKIPGYSFSVMEAGIRYENRLDYALIKSDFPCNAAGVFTTCKVIAAPVKLCKERINNPINAILVNSTIANAVTGTQGYENAKVLTQDIAKLIDIETSSILMSSTGVIGRQLPVDKMLSSHKELVQKLNPNNGQLFSKAIMTTDTFPKFHVVQFNAAGKTYYIGGTAKGSGMIAPNMATLLAYILTDAPIKKGDLEKIFKDKIEKSLNSLTIDGDMSTNDTAIILSPIKQETLSSDSDLSAFSDALEAVLMKLTEMLAYDGEGATKLIRIHVRGAKNYDDAKKVGKAIAESPLVKTAFFGSDPNWGRIACAAGYSGADLEEEKLSISFGNIKVLKNGTPVDFDNEALKSIISQREIDLDVDLGLGTAETVILTCDLSYDYVKINGEYTT